MIIEINSSLLNDDINGVEALVAELEKAKKNEGKGILP